jgi:hypothetical protein
MKTYLSTVLVALASAFLLVLGGCATTDTAAFYAAQRDAETAKYNAITALAKDADPTTRAILAVTLGGGMAGGQGGVRQAAPDTTALQWASVLVPGAVQAYGLVEQGRTARMQSANSTTLGISTNNTFQGIAGLIQAPGAVTNTDRHDTITPTPVVVTPVVPITPVVQIVPIVGK